MEQNSMSIDWNEIDLRRSKRKTLAMEIQPNGNIVVRAPMRMSERQIVKFVESHEDWIRKHRAKMELSQQETVEPLTAEEIDALANKAMEVIPERVKHYAPLVGVTYGRITIRNQKTKWGSCSSKGNLNFNCLLMLMPMEVIDSIVVHELCHRKYMNHSKDFYEEIYRVYPEYDRWNRWLKKNGSQIMRRMTG